jgi:branched-chain amino acid transport system permease protein
MKRHALGYLAFAVIVAILPFVGVYPIFVMKVLCYALFACAFNLLLGFTGLLSFGHAAFLGTAAYVTGHAIKVCWPASAQPPCWVWLWAPSPFGAAASISR